MERKNNQKETYTETEVVAMLKEIKRGLDIIVNKIIKLDKKLDKVVKKI